MKINERRVVDELCRRHFSSFVQMAFTEAYPGEEFVDNWHIHAIADRFLQLHRGQTTRQIITIPPRHLKSFIGSICFPAYVLGHDPGAKLVCVSCSQELAEGFAHQTRRLMEASWYRRLFPKTRFDPRRCTKHDLATTQNGHRMAASVGGTVTGKGGDYIIIDDPMKAQDAGSETIREQTREWFRSTIQSRLDKPRSGRIVVIAQRLHEDDLVGHLLEQPGWKTLNLPLIAAEREVTQVTGDRKVFRRPGRLLHDARIGPDEADALRFSMGTAAFEAQYNQRPVTAGGYVFKAEWLQYDERPVNPRLCEYIIQSWDTAYMTAEKNDWTVCATFGVIGSELHILNIYREKLEFPDQKRMIYRLRDQWRSDLVIVEGAASGLALYQDIARNPRDQWIRYHIPQRSKAERAENQTVKFEQRRVFLPADADWLKAFERELFAFPNGKHDDQVDAVVQFLSALDTGRLHNAAQLARQNR